MAKTEFIRARVEPILKHNAEEIFQQLGLNPTEAITLFYKQVEVQKGLPFTITLPNRETRQTFEETDRGEGIIRCENTDDMFNQLGI